MAELHAFETGGLVAAGEGRPSEENHGPSQSNRGAADCAGDTGTVVGVFTTGTTVQVYLLADSVAAESWSGSEPNVQA